MANRLLVAPNYIASPEQFPVVPRESHQTEPQTAVSTERQYREQTEQSRKQFENAAPYMPGGNTRGVMHYSPYPIYAVDAEGFVLTDADDNEYVDFLNNYTSLIHGHTPSECTSAAIEQIHSGSAPGAPTSVEIDWARHMVERAPALEKIRFTNSGTEATMHAIRAARAYTGRDIIAKFEGVYHGTHDDAQISVHPPSHLAGPPTRPNSVPDSAGVPDSKREEVLTLPYNDINGTVSRLEAKADELAGVLLCPTMGSSVVPADEGFIRALDEWTTRNDVPLIFDEVISFRVATGGAHAMYGIKPDLLAYGKLIGGGFPVGAFGGRDELMAPYDPRGGSDIVHSGTFNANPVTAAAGLAALNRYDQSEVRRLNDLTDTLTSGVRTVAEDHGVKLQVNQVGSLFNVYLSADPVETFRDKSAPEPLVRSLHLALLNRGVRVAPKLMGCLSTPMGEAEVTRFVEVFDEALAEVVPEFETHAPHLVK